MTVTALPESHTRAHTLHVTRSLETLCRCCLRADAAAGTRCARCLAHCELPDTDPAADAYDGAAFGDVTDWLDAPEDAHEDEFCLCGAALVTTLVRYAGTARRSCPSCALVSDLVA